MKTAKRIVALLLIGALVCSMAACSKKEMPSRGTVNGKTYQSKFIGIQCTLDDSWSIYDEARLAQVAGTTADQIGNDALAETIQNTPAVYDFYAENTTTYATMNINMTDLGTTLFDGNSEEELAKAVLPELQATLKDSGIENCLISIETVTFAGQEHPCFVVFGVYSGIQLYEKMVMIVRSGIVNYVTVCTFLEDTTDELLALFTAY